MLLVIFNDKERKKCYEFVTVKFNQLDLLPVLGNTSIKTKTKNDCGKTHKDIDNRFIISRNTQLHIFLCSAF